MQLNNIGEESIHQKFEVVIQNDLFESIKDRNLKGINTRYTL